jgi:hypothetical protein
MHYIYAVLLVARLDDLIKIVPIFLFLLFWVMGQIAEAKKKAKMSRPAQPPVPPSQSPMQAGATQPPPATDPLRQQVDDFLRRAGGQPTTAKTVAAAGTATPMPVRPAPPDRDRIEILLAGDASSTNRPPLSQPQRGSTATRPTLTTSRPQNPPRPQRASTPRPLSVAEHVAEHVTSAARQISDDAARLGERVAAVDKQFDAQVQQKFGHEIGTMGDRLASRAQDQQPAAPAVVNPAVQIFDLLANSNGMRQAIVVNEILRRPEERW